MAKRTVATVKIDLDRRYLCYLDSQRRRGIYKDEITDWDISQYQRGATTARLTPK